MNFFTMLIIFVMIFSRIGYSNAEEIDSKLDNIFDENVQEITIDNYDDKGLDAAILNAVLLSNDDIELDEELTEAQPDSNSRFSNWKIVLIALVGGLAIVAFFLAFVKVCSRNISGQDDENKDPREMEMETLPFPPVPSAQAEP